MSIVLSLVNPNTLVLDKIEIYRASSKTGALSLIDTIAGNSLTYTDNTAPINAVSWYVVRAYLGGNYIDSYRVPLGYFPDVGPGPQSIIRGNWEVGYFGPITDLTTMPRLADLAGIVPVTSMPPQSNYTDATVIHKWVIGGKIVFIPETYYNNKNNQNSWGAFNLLPGASIPAGNKITKGVYTFGVRPPYASTLLGTTKAAAGVYGYTGVVAKNCGLSAEDGTFKVSELCTILNMGAPGYSPNNIYLNTKSLVS